MTVAATVTLEANFAGTVWTDVTADYRSEPGIKITRGIRGNSPTDRVASTGSMNITLDNSTHNSGGTLGWYSPDHANARTGFDIGMKARLSIAYGGTPYYKFLGKVDNISPSFGQYRDRAVDVTAVDYMDELATHNLGLIVAKTDVRGDELITAVVANMPNAPAGTAYGTGVDNYAHGLHNDKDESTRGLGAIQKIAMSGMDDVFVTGNLTNGETLVYRSRHGRILNTGVTATFTDTMTGLKVNRRRESLYNNLNVTYHPFQRDTNPAILYSIQSEISLGPGEVYTFTARYTDPLSSGRRVSSDQMITPVADTDYKMAHRSGGKGNSLNAYLTVETFNESGVAGGFGSNSTKITLTNTHTTKTGYIGRFNLRGYGLYDYEPITLTHLDTAGQSTYGDRPLKYDMWYQQDKNVANDFLNFFKAHYLVPVTDVGSLEISANVSDALMLAALQCDVGSRITLTETMTGLSTDYFVNGYALQIDAGELIKCTLGPLARTDLGGPYGQIGNATYGKIGNTLKIGY